MISHILIDPITFIFNKFDTPLGIAAVGSFFGAAGGYVSVMIANRRTEIFTKVGQLKMAVAMTHSIFNQFFSLKKQHIKELSEQYEKNKAEFIASKKGKAGGEIVIPFNFQSISFPYVDFGLINSKLFEKTDLAGRGFILATTLVRSIYELKNQITFRHTVINEINKLSVDLNLNDHDKACIYYGIRLEHSTLGNIIYQNYSDVMKAIKNSNDDVIWFSKELTQELLDVANGIAKKLTLSKPKVGSIDYSDIEMDILPKDENYKDWREKFKKA